MNNFQIVVDAANVISEKAGQAINANVSDAMLQDATKATIDKALTGVNNLLVDAKSLFDMFKTMSSNTTFEEWYEAFVKANQQSLMMRDLANEPMVVAFYAAIADTTNVHEKREYFDNVVKGLIPIIPLIVTQLETGLEHFERARYALIAKQKSVSES